MTPEPLIRLRGLRKRYGKRRALDGVDLVVDRREILGVVGPDGAGKTTLLRALAGLLEVEGEEAFVLGHDLRADVTALKAKIGYVPQAFGLQRDLSVIENLRFTAKVHRLGRAAFESRVARLLDRTLLAPFRDRQAGALSGGMKQKLAISCALLPEPELVILDEPTAGIDVAARAEIWALLEERKEHSLVVHSTSYLDEAAASDRLVYLDDGRVVATGTPFDLEHRVLVDLYRAWGDDPRAIARAARQFPYVESARATGRFARIEVDREQTPGAVAVRRDLAAAGARFVEALEVDMESTLLALAHVHAS